MEHFRNIDLFVAVARTGGFRTASKLLMLPNSTVSRRIAQMEQSLGIRLFNRTTRRVELTESGRLYFTRCQALVEEAEAALAEVTQQARSPSGVIRASLPVDFATQRLSKIMADFQAVYPAVRFDLDLSPRQSDLIAEPVDFVIRIGRPAESGLIQRKLTEVALGIFAAPAYLARCGTPQIPTDLAQHPVLSVLGRALQFTPIGGGPTVHIQPSAPVSMNNINWLKHFALNGLGPTALPLETAQDAVASGALVPLLQGWVQPAVEVYVLTQTRLLPARVRLFLDYLFLHIAD